MRFIFLALCISAARAGPLVTEQPQRHETVSPSQSSQGNTDPWIGMLARILVEYAAADDDQRNADKTAVAFPSDQDYQGDLPVNMIVNTKYVNSSPQSSQMVTVKQTVDVIENGPASVTKVAVVDQNNNPVTTQIFSQQSQQHEAESILYSMTPSMAASPVYEQASTSTTSVVSASVQAPSVKDSKHRVTSSFRTVIVSQESLRSTVGASSALSSLHAPSPSPSSSTTPKFGSLSTTTALSHTFEVDASDVLRTLPVTTAMSTVLFVPSVAADLTTTKRELDLARLKLSSNVDTSYHIATRPELKSESDTATAMPEASYKVSESTSVGQPNLAHLDVEPSYKPVKSTPATQAAVIKMLPSLASFGHIAAISDIQLIHNQNTKASPSTNGPVAQTAAAETANQKAVASPMSGAEGADTMTAHNYKEIFAKIIAGQDFGDIHQYGHAE